MPTPTLPYSLHADRIRSPLFASLWVKAWGEQYPTEVAPFSSCTHGLLQQLEQRLQLKTTDSFVDLGCGTGGVGMWLAQKTGARLTGIDRCPDATAIATERAQASGIANQTEFLTCDFSDIKLERASVDAVFSIDAFPAAQDIDAALAEVQRILKPGGTFVFTARQLGPDGRHFKKVGADWSIGLQRHGFHAIEKHVRPETSNLWRAIYNQWLQHETQLRQELLPETVDALIAEAQRGIPAMQDGRPWYLIRALA